MERYRLVKGFGRQEYREEFLDGRLYMNSLGYFWSNGNEAQRDAAEGLSLEIEPMTLEALPIEFRRVQMHCAQVCPSGFASCNILCFAMDTVKNINGLPCIETLGNPRELGEYFIAIDDIDQFSQTGGVRGGRPRGGIHLFARGLWASRLGSRSGSGQSYSA